MKTNIMLAAVSMLLVLTIGALSFAGEQPRPQASSAPSIEGTYKFSSRKLPDGTVLKPPDIMGLQTYTKSYRNFNVLNKNAEDKYDSLSIVSTYTLTPTEYTETPLFSINVCGQEIIRHDLSGQTQRAAVTVDAGRLQFHRPVEQRSVVFEGNGFTSTSANNNVDVWEKVD
jgi:hypothetical protein